METRYYGMDGGSPIVGLCYIVVVLSATTKQAIDRRTVNVVENATPFSGI
jgi:hypothetical protein